MTQESTIRALLEDVRAGRVSVDDAQAALRAGMEAQAEGALLDIDRMDAMAREVNNTYIAGGGSSAQNWAQCDYESRMSSRASADFYPALLRAAGRTEEQVRGIFFDNLNAFWERAL